MKNLKPNHFLVTIILLVAISKVSFSQMQVTTGDAAQWYVQNVLAGPGVQISNVTYTGDLQQMGEFTNGNTTNIGMDRGFIMSLGKATEVIGPNNETGHGFDYGNFGNDPDLQQLVNGNQFDKVVLEFDFVPQGDKLSLDFIWGSEEYLEYVNQSYNDVFGFFLSGPGINGPYSNNSINIAQVPGGGGVVSIDNVHGAGVDVDGNNFTASNGAWYINNDNGTTMQFDGFTQPIPVSLDVQACQTYHIKMTMADLGDGIYDSGIFLKRHSFASNQLGVNTSYENTLTDQAVEGCVSGKFTIAVPSPVLADSVITYTIAGSATNGVDYETIATSVTILAGQESVEIPIIPLSDTLLEGVETVELTFNYVDKCTGVGVVASININEARSFDPGDNVINCGETSIEAYVIGTADFEWYPTVTGGEIFATSKDADLSTTFAISSMTQFTGIAPNRVFSAFVEDATKVHEVIHKLTPDFVFDNNTFRNSYSQETYLYFNVSTPFTLNGLDIRYSSSSANGTLIFNVKNQSGDIIGSDTLLNLANTNGNGQVVSLSDMNIQIPMGTGYYMDIVGSNVDVNWVQTGPVGWAPEVLTIGTGQVGTITGNGVSWAPDASPYYFNWDVSAKANSDVCGRVEVLIPESCSCTPPTSVNVAAKETSICVGDSIILEGVVELGVSQNGGYRYTWFHGTDIQGTANALAYEPLKLGNSALLNAGEYTLRVEDGDAGADECSLEAKETIVVNDLPIAPTVAPISYCKDEIAVNLTATGTNLKWYTSLTGGIGSTSAPLPVTSSIGVTSYYVSQTNVSGCEGPRAKLDVTINEAPLAPTVSALNYCKDEIVDTLLATGTNLKWYSALIGGVGSITSPTPSTSSVGSISYYVSQTNTSGCESPRAKLDVTINDNPLAPTVTPISYCKDRPAIALIATGTNLKWYLASTGGISSISAPVPLTSTVGTVSYYVSQTNVSGCESPRAKLDVTINDLPIAPTVAPISYCKDEIAVNLTATGTNLKWYTSLTGGIGSTSAPLPVTSSIGVTSYYVSQTNVSGCEGPRAKLDVTINEAPPAPTVSALNYCKDEIVGTLLATGTSLKWYSDTVGGVGSLSSPVPSTGSVGVLSYYVSQTNASGCEGPRINLDVEITGLPTIAFGDNEKICSGETSSLVFTATGIGPFDVVYTDGVMDFPLEGMVDGYSVLVNPTATTRYELKSIKMSDEPNCVGEVLPKDTTLVVVDFVPKVISIQQFCDYDLNYKVKAFVSGGSGIYQLLKGDGSIVGDTLFSDLIVDDVVHTFEIDDENSCGPVSFDVTDSCECISYAGEFTDASLLLLCANQEAVFNHDGTQVLDGSDAFEYVLTTDTVGKEAGLLKRSKKASFTYDETTMVGGVEYYIYAVVGDSTIDGNVVLSALCTDFSNPLPVSFIPMPNASLSGQSPICEGDSTELNFIVNAFTEFQIGYTENGENLEYTSKDIKLEKVITPDSTSMYELDSIRYTSSPVCRVITNSSVLIEVNDSILFADSSSLCDFTNGTYVVNVKLNDGTGAYSLLESTNSGAFSGDVFTSEEINSGQDYKFVFVDENLCNTITIVGNEVCPCITAAGDLDDLDPIELCENESITVGHQGNEVLDENDAFEFILYADKEAPLTSVVSRNSTGIFTFDVASMSRGVAYYVSSVAGNDNGNHQVDLLSGCVEVSPLKELLFKKLPSINISSIKSICEGGLATLEFTANQLSAYTFTYSDGVSSMTENSNSNNYSIVVQPSETTEYKLETIQYQTAPLCLVSLTEAHTIEVIEQPSVKAVSPNVDGCIGENHLLSIELNEMEAVPIVTWYREGQFLQSNNSIDLSVSTSGVYRAIVDNKGCKDTSALINVNLIDVQIDAVANPSHVFYGESSELEAIGELDYIYEWEDLISGERYDGAVVSVTPEQTTEYMAYAYKGNCSDSAFVEVYVYPPVSAPYFFSPNNDGENDVWMVSGLEEFPTTSIYIYNRWGTEVAFLSKQENEWDGTSKSGNMLPDGVYFYVIEASFPDLDNKDHIRFSGNVTLSH